MHFKFSILLGISEPAYNQSDLANFKKNDNKTFEFEGKEYTQYKASQVQRKLETAMRHEKDTLNIAKASGDRDLENEAKYNINLLTSKYKQFSDASELPTKMERTSVQNFHRVAKEAKINKSVDISRGNGIIKETYR